MKCHLILLAVCLSYASCQKKKEEKVDEGKANSESKLDDLVIKGIDFSKAESIASVLKGVNMLRGVQNAKLALDGSRELNIIESSGPDRIGCSLGFVVRKDGISGFNQEGRISREEFLIRLKKLSEAAKAGGHGVVPLVIHFHSDVSGEKGHQILKDLSDNGMALLMYKETTKEERALEEKRLLEQKLKRKPSSPSDVIKKRAEEVAAPNGE